MDSKQKKFYLKAVCDGKVITVDQVEDIVFSQRMIGDGFSIVPSDGRIFSPVDGVISEVATTKHAYYITLDDHHKLLIHIGEDTLMLNGEGFTVNVEKGQRVEKGDLLGTIDLEVMKEKNHDIVISTIILFNNAYELDVRTYPQPDALANETLACEVVSTLKQG